MPCVWGAMCFASPARPPDPSKRILPLFSSPVIVQLRGATRKLGLNRLISRLMSRGRYEDQFGPALKGEIRPGDTVWDIGANLGLYTQEFLSAAGPTGRVVAFEPVPSCFDRLRERFAGSGQVKLVNAAVGEHDGEICMSLDPDPLAATHRIGGPAIGGGSGSGAHTIRGIRGGRGWGLVS